MKRIEAVNEINNLTEKVFKLVSARLELKIPSTELIDVGEQGIRLAKLLMIPVKDEYLSSVESQAFAIYLTLVTATI